MNGPIIAPSTVRWLGVCGLLVTMLSGCAAVRPLNGIPASHLPGQFKQPSRSGKDTIHLGLLRQTPPAAHLVDSGDVLGVYIEGVLGRREDVPPVYFPEKGEAPPSLGYPIPVREDGTISLPQTGPIYVRGLTIRAVEERIRQAYTVDKENLRRGRERILVSLQRPRSYQVLVLRQEEAGGAITDGTGFNLGALKRGNGQLVNLPIYKNDVAHALAQTNGLPGLDAENAIYIIRSRARGTNPMMPVSHQAYGVPGGHSPATIPSQYGHVSPQQIVHSGMPTVNNPQVIKIPVRLAKGEIPTFTPNDIILEDGDIVFIESRETEIFYTGGLLGGGQFTLPRDYDLDVLEAIAVAQGQGNQQGNIRSAGGPSGLNQDVTISASHVVILRKLPNGQQVPIKVNLHKALRRPQERLVIQPGDYILLQYSPLEAVGAFLERHLLEGALFGIASSRVFGDNN